MNFAELIKTKTFWTGIGLIGYGIVLIISGNSEEGMPLLFEGAGFIFLRSGVAKLQQK